MAKVETVQHDGAPLAQLRLTTKALLDKFNPGGAPSGKSDYYEKRGRWQIDYGVGASRGQVTAQATGRNDHKAESLAHQRFHAKAALLEA